MFQKNLPLLSILKTETAEFYGSLYLSTNINGAISVKSLISCLGEKTCKIFVIIKYVTYRSCWNMSDSCSEMSVVVNCRAETFKLSGMVKNTRYLSSGPAQGGWKWGDRPRPRSWGGPALQAFFKILITSLFIPSVWVRPLVHLWRVQQDYLKQ
jgi:hypothetical protein